ncbi:MAG: chromosome segregation protein SMC [Hyphomicrobium sp.]
MKISRLRLLGFKSFVEPTELVIERGLTGVVGPNGCGKSNLLEALRWVMGETSHKSMRAASMDDVIFSGTTTRPGRSVAEVTMFLDNRERQAPAEFNDTDVIEITRRIEREAGSAYRINGKESRARDIKILFEDAATGARSPALVRQGQIAEIVNAKPEQRRRILEDAAGVAGLHSRRHEAELRLRATEANLARIADVLGQLTTQIESLKRQARQARRYKELSGDIRKAEALLAHVAWTEAQATVTSEESHLNEALARLAVATEAESRALADEARLAEALPPLREEEAARGAALGRIQVERDNFEREVERTMARERELKARAAQLQTDLAREENFVVEAREIIAGLDGEIGQLVAAEEGADAAEADARWRVEQQDGVLRRAEQLLAEWTTRAAEARAKRKSLETSRAEREQAVARLERQIAALAVQAREIAGRAPDADKLKATADAGQALSREIDTIEQATLAAEDQVRTLAAQLHARREDAGRARMAASALKTERETLLKLVAPPRADGLPPVVDRLRVSPGYEAALGAALGDDLDAPADAEAPVHWRHLEPRADDAGLPADAEPLILHVGAPPELARRLKQIGVVSRDLGHRLQPHLKPGQRLVSREGDLWRWDGFVAAADGATPAAQRLTERNRLAGMATREEQAQALAERLSLAEREAAETHIKAEAEERRLRQLWRATQTRLAATRDALTEIERAARETESRLAAVTGARARSDEDMVSARAALETVVEQIAFFDDADPIEPELERAQAAALAERQRAAEVRARLAALEREHQVRTERAAAARAEWQRWTTRSAGAEQQIGALKTRQQETSDELTPLVGLPVRLDASRQTLLNSLAAAEGERRQAADRLAEADSTLRTAVHALRTAQGEVATGREVKARTEARLEGARQRRQEESRRIRETFETAPEHLLAIAEVAPGTPLPAFADLDRQLGKLRGDRERLGGVNLQADDELVALQQQFTTLDAERADVEQAINKLRGAIGHLNREAKKRLDEAFTTVDGHFRRLFTTLFGGGEARLEIVESEDPLEGGLEIIAKPPGKKPATLSLLSGGEQTLTALSLIFAVFLTNPSPICVLDEVDAPLDDANVDRFCTLMEKMAAETDTRFLVITHHPMTMTRMNRLFGVTMAEKGISQLVSVDLETAQSFREAG